MYLSFILGGFVVSMIGGTFSSRIIMVIFMLLKTFADSLEKALSLSQKSLTADTTNAIIKVWKKQDG